MTTASFFKVSTVSLFMVVLSKANVLQREESGNRAANDRELCNGGRKTIFLSQGQSQVIQTPGFTRGQFIKGCEVLYEVEISRDDSDYAQWRIKVEVEEMMMPCSASYLHVIEDGTTRKKETLCNEKRRNKVFFSHEHLLDIKFKNKNRCPRGHQCSGAQLKVSAEYVCGGSFDVEGGRISSPLWPSNYNNDETCFWDIEAPEDQKIKFGCDYFNLSSKCPKGVPCKKNSGFRTNLEDLTRSKSYEGKALQGPNNSFETKTNHLTLYFYSNSYDVEKSARKYGFNCTYSFV